VLLGAALEIIVTPESFLREAIEKAIIDCLREHRIPKTEKGYQQIIKMISEILDIHTSPGYEIIIEPLTEEQRKLRMSPAITLRFTER
jgi:hypothetical protein